MLQGFIEYTVSFVKANAKAITALIVPIIVQIAGTAGLNLDAGIVDTLTLLITGYLVWRVPNTPAAQ